MSVQGWQIPFIVGGVVRLAYGVAAINNPERMARRRLAPRLHGKAGPRMNLRGFGGAQTAIALYTLAMARTRDGARRALPLNATADGLDTLVSALEGRDRGRIDYEVAGGLGLNLAGILCWALAARELSRP